MPIPPAAHYISCPLQPHLLYIEHRYSAKDVTKHVFAIVSAKCFQIRTHSVLYEADNVLTPAVIQVQYHSKNFLWSPFMRQRTSH